MRTHRRTTTLLLPLCVAVLALTAGGLQSSPGGAGNGRPDDVWRPAPGAPSFIDGEVLVGFRADARAEDRANARANLGASRLHSFKSGAEHWRLGHGVGVGQAIDRLKRNPHVRYAEPN